MGQAEQRIIHDCYRRKRPLPERIANAPDLFTGLELIFDAFIELNTTRQTGWSPGPIPAWAIYEHCDILGLTDDEIADMHCLIRKMDQAFLTYMTRKSKDSA